jgi:hypothetical protein
MHLNATITDIRLADGGDENAIKRVLNTFSLRKLKDLRYDHYMLLSGGISWAILGDEFYRKGEIDIARSYYRKSMEKGFIYGMIQYATIMYSKKYYNTSLTYYEQILTHPQWKYLNSSLRGYVYNDMSLCYYYSVPFVKNLPRLNNECNEVKDSHDNFWKYNTLAIKEGIIIAINNAANVLFKGTIFDKENILMAEIMYNLAKLKMIESDQRDWSDNIDYINKQLKTIENNKPL